jgi:hypothetical protein
VSIISDQTLGGKVNFDFAFFLAKFYSLPSIGLDLRETDLD